MDTRTVSMEHISTVKKKIKVELPLCEVEFEIEAAYAELDKNANIPGFRGGKAPRAVLRQKYGANLMRDVATKLIERTLPEAIKGEKVFPVSKPELTILQIGEATPLIFSAVFEVKPDLDIKGYKDILIEREEISVTDADIEGTLIRVADERAEFRAVKRAAENGDMCVLDFEGTMNGKPFKNSTATDYPVVVGDTILPGFNEILMGTSAGDEKELDTTFPKDYPEKVLADQDVHFKIKVKGVRERIVPPIDNALAVAYGLQTLAELKKKIREDLLRGKNNTEDERMKEAIITELVDQNPFPVPDAIQERYFEGIMKQVEKMSEESNNPLVKEKNKSPEIVAQYKDIAKAHAIRDMILDWIAVHEKVDVTNEDIEAFAKNAAEQTGEEPDRVLAKMQRDGSMNAVMATMRDQKVYDIILAKSKEAAGEAAQETTPGE